MPHCSYPNVLSMVEVNDPDVLNMLIDMCSIETTILIRDKREARQVMGDRPPRNARNVRKLFLVAIVTVAMIYVYVQVVCSY